MNARTRRTFLIDAGAWEKEEKLFAQLVYWQIQFPDQRWTVTDGRSTLSILQVHAIRFMADMRAALFVRSHGLFSYEFLNRALFYLNTKFTCARKRTVPENIRNLWETTLPLQSISAVNQSNQSFHNGFAKTIAYLVNKILLVNKIFDMIKFDIFINKYFYQ